MQENPLPEHLPPANEIPAQPEKYLRLKNFVRQHPYWSAIFISLYAMLMIGGIRLIVFLIDLSSYKVSYVPGNLVGEVILAFVWVILPVSLLNWWNAPGFQTLRTWPPRIGEHKALFLGLFLLLGLLPLLLLAFSTTIHRTAFLTIVLVGVLCLLVGIAEEGLFRGLILNMILPEGIWRSVFLSSLLFGGVHILNVFVGFPLNAAILEMWSAFGLGMFLAAVRLRTNSLRPGIIAHAWWDWPLIVLNLNRRSIPSPTLFQALLIGGIICAIYLVCTFIVLRPKKLRELRIAYGLIPPPADPPGIQA